MLRPMGYMIILHHLDMLHHMAHPSAYQLMLHLDILYLMLYFMYFTLFVHCTAMCRWKMHLASLGHMYDSMMFMP